MYKFHEYPTHSRAMIHRLFTLMEVNLKCQALDGHVLVKESGKSVKANK